MPIKPRNLIKIKVIGRRPQGEIYADNTGPCIYAQQLFEVTEQVSAGKGIIPIMRTGTEPGPTVYTHKCAGLQEWIQVYAIAREKIYWLIEGYLNNQKKIAKKRK